MMLGPTEWVQYFSLQKIQWLALASTMFFAFNCEAEQNSAFSNNAQAILKHIDVSAFVRRVDQISAKSFTAHAEYRFQWQDNSLRHLFPVDTSLVGENVQQFLTKHWHPAIRFGNLVSTPRNEWQGLVIDNQGRVELVWSFVGEYSLANAISNFPFDKIKLEIAIQSEIYTSESVLFRVNRYDNHYTGIASNQNSDDWKLGNIRVNHNFANGWNGSQTSVLTFQLPAARIWWTYFTTVFIPFFAIMLMPLIIFWLPDGELVKKVTAVVSSLLALVAFNFSLNLFLAGSMPATSALAVLLEIGYLYVILVVIALMTVVNPVVSSRLFDKCLAHEIYRYLRWATPVSFTILVAWVIMDAAV